MTSAQESTRGVDVDTQPVCRDTVLFLTDMINVSAKQPALDTGLILALLSVTAPLISEPELSQQQSTLKEKKRRKDYAVKRD